MPLLTFDQPGPGEFDLEELAGTETPDEIECGENNQYWIRVQRRKKLMLLVSKINGKVLKSVEIAQPEFERIAASYGVGPRQAGAVRAALVLKLGAPQ